MEKAVEKPPPPCEAMDERCEAKSATRARIAQSELAFTPPASWIYAQESDMTIASASEAGATLALTGYVAGEAKKQTANRDAALVALAKKLDVTLPKKMVWKKKPDDTMKVSDLTVSLWQFDGATRGTKKGPVLVFSAPLADQHAVLGVAFVPNDDGANSDAAVLRAIKSIGPKSVTQ